MKTKTSQTILGSALVGILVPLLSLGAELRIIDKSGATNEVKDVLVDYTIYPPSGSGSYIPDRASNGIRAKSGEALQFIEWARIRSVTFGPRGTNCQVVLTNGQKKEVMLLGLETDLVSGVFPAVLCGDTDLGKLKLKLSEIKTIEVLKP